MKKETRKTLKVEPDVHLYLMNAIKYPENISQTLRRLLKIRVKQK